MPIEIRELVIKAVIDGSEENRKTNIPANKISNDQIDEVVCLCVDKVLEVLKEKNER